MKFNMGCGLNHKDGYVNVDAMPQANPDEVVDLETTPWPWPDDCAEEVRFNHALEHMGADTRVFLKIMQELYRICAPGAEVVINVPDPRHLNYITDPTHVRPITPHVLKLFDRAANEAWAKEGRATTPLAIYTGVDFEMKAYQAVLAEPWRSRRASGEISLEDLQHAIRSYNNVVEEWRILLTARKAPADAAT